MRLIPVDPEHLRQQAVRKARRDDELLVPRDESQAEFWHPIYRDAYDAERERLGTCAPTDHAWDPDVVSIEMPEVVLRVRLPGRPIDVCATCGVWRDR